MLPLVSSQETSQEMRFIILLYSGLEQNIKKSMSTDKSSD